jgi:prepilin-type N-terminal cleavage/methylation domain-containing protein
MIRNRRGLTLTEMLIASAIAAIVGTGTMSAFVMAARAQRRMGGPQQVEAAALAQQLIEAMRNVVAEDSAFLFSNADGAWHSDSGIVALPASTSSESILGLAPKRCFRLTKLDPACTASCAYESQVRVCWNDISNCPPPC